MENPPPKRSCRHRQSNTPIIIYPTALLLTALATATAAYNQIIMVPRRAPAYPCGQCSKGCGTNSIFCSSCQSWIHRRCVPMSPEILTAWSAGSENLNFMCPSCAYDRGSFSIQDALERYVSHIFIGQLFYSYIIYWNVILFIYCLGRCYDA